MQAVYSPDILAQAVEEVKALGAAYFGAVSGPCGCNQHLSQLWHTLTPSQETASRTPSSLSFGPLNSLAAPHCLTTLASRTCVTDAPQCACVCVDRQGRAMKGER
jgi:hypothetical protein